MAACVSWIANAPEYTPPLTIGFGPRFLHSTGLFVQLTPPAKPERDLAIPCRSHSFGALLLVQADGDLEALRQKGRRTLRIDLGSDPHKGLEALLVLPEANITP